MFLGLWHPGKPKPLRCSSVRDKMKINKCNELPLKPFLCCLSLAASVCVCRNSLLTLAGWGQLLSVLPFFICEEDSAGENDSSSKCAVVLRFCCCVWRARAWGIICSIPWEAVGFNLGSRPHSSFLHPSPMCYSDKYTGDGNVRTE